MTSARAVPAVALRCPVCGHRLEAPLPQRCPLCEFDFSDDRVTGADVTPYAKAYAHGEGAWLVMAEWVWFADHRRLKHLALMRASVASRRFARVNILLLVFGLGLVEATRTGWQPVNASAAVHPTGSTKPAGAGWLRVAATPRPVPPAHAPKTPADLWWNPAQALIAVPVGMAIGLLLMWLLGLLTRAGVTWAHRPPYRHEQRMTAAILYSTAWGIMLVAAAALVGLRPLGYIGGTANWRWYPPDRGIMLSGAVVAGVGVALWWFWLVRLSATAPASTRRRVVALFAVGVPLMVIAAAVGWWYAVQELYLPVFRALDLDF